MNLKASIYRYLVWKYYVYHFVLDLCDGELLILLRPLRRTYLYFVEAFKILGLHVGAQNLIDTKTGKLYILLRYKANCIVRLLIGNITQEALRRVHVLEPMEYFRGVNPSFEAQHLVFLMRRVPIVAEIQIGKLIVEINLTSAHEKRDRVLCLPEKVSDLLGNGHGFIVSRGRQSHVDLLVL